MSQVAITRYSEKEKENTSQESGNQVQKNYKQTDDPRNSVPDNLWIEWEADYHKNKNGDCRR